MLYMPKHRGFPSRLPSTDYQFTIRQPVKKGLPPLFDREVVAAEDPFDPQHYEAMLRVDLRRAEQSFPEVFRPDWAPGQN